MKLNSVKEKLKNIKGQIGEIENIKNIKELEEFEKKYLGRKSGEIIFILKGLSKLSLEEKKDIGVLANKLKNEIIFEIKKQKGILQNSKSDLSIDVTLPTDDDKLGHLHPISKVQYELEDIFSSMGFMVLDGPELESEYYNFDALNIQKTHPARDMWDTFFVEGGKKDNQFVMRTHTSPVQIRAMHKYGAPLRCIVPGQCYRNEATDARHEFNLHQVEGFMVGEDISIANMVSVIETFLSAIFKKKVKARLRPGYFPFVEPGFELDFGCLLCHGKGCRVCKDTGWVEFMGAGIVHPNVLKAGNIDPKKYSGFAFGFGTERLLMMKYGIDDIRLFRGGDLRFLRQF
jgi:phenylalanyl-tRNA synthetase alpha chain